MTRFCQIYLFGKIGAMDNRLWLPPKPRSQTKDCGMSKSLIQPTRSNQLLYNICNCAITLSIVLTSNKASYPEPEALH